MNKVILVFLLLVLCVGSRVALYANEPPTILSFEVEYEVSVLYGRYVFSNAPTNVELITD